MCQRTGALITFFLCLAGLPAMAESPATMQSPTPAVTSGSRLPPDLIGTTDDGRPFRLEFMNTADGIPLWQLLIGQGADGESLTHTRMGSELTVHSPVRPILLQPRLPLGIYLKQTDMDCREVMLSGINEGYDGMLSYNGLAADNRYMTLINSASLRFVTFQMPDAGRPHLCHLLAKGKLAASADEPQVARSP